MGVLHVCSWDLRHFSHDLFEAADNGEPHHQPLLLGWGDLEDVGYRCPVSPPRGSECSRVGVR